MVIKKPIMKYLAEVLILTISMFMVGYSQADTTKGIAFEQGMNWQEVLQKAKAEKKYVFVDCYTTWCGPCKAMEQTVYPDKAVGDLYNKEFISVKLQMDRTPNDNDSVKNWYHTAKMIETAYRINAYPSFLFFDPTGKPVHKAVGYKNEKEFIKLAGDAQKTKRQYYAILQNFRPGKIDTAEEKGLARSLKYVDQHLGGKLAFDYLHRIPIAQLDLQDNHNLIMWFYDNSQVRKLASDYINQLPEKEFYNISMLDFLYNACIPQDKGFKFIYNHQTETDTVMHNPDWAQSAVAKIIVRIDFQPLFEAAKESGYAPNFDSLGSAITKNYNAYYSARVMQDGKIKWYSWLVHEKKLIEYWPELIEADIEKLRRIWDEQQLRDFSASTDVNNICYTDIFQHCDDSVQLNLAVGWLKELIQISPNDADVLDTYACLLYKTGKVDEALKTEVTVLQLYMKYRKRGTYGRMMHTTLAIQRMWKGEKIWEEKEFQD
jgi:thioredoxin-related protein